MLTTFFLQWKLTSLLQHIALKRALLFAYSAVVNLLLFLSFMHCCFKKKKANLKHQTDKLKLITSPCLLASNLSCQWQKMRGELIKRIPLSSITTALPVRTLGNN